MEEKYQRGDLISGAPQKLPPKEIVARGSAMEDMIKDDGWKYLADWIQEQIEGNVNMLTNIKNVDIDKINDLRIIIQIYKGLLRKPMEFIEQRNKLQT